MHTQSPEANNWIGATCFNSGKWKYKKEHFTNDYYKDEKARLDRFYKAFGKGARWQDFANEMTVPIARLAEKSKAFEKWEHTKRNGLYYKPPEPSDDN